MAWAGGSTVRADDRGPWRRIAGPWSGRLQAVLLRAVQIRHDRFQACAVDGTLRLPRCLFAPHRLAPAQDAEPAIAPVG
jgi:hypothetical protein